MTIEDPPQSSDDTVSSSVLEGWAKAGLVRVVQEGDHLQRITTPEDLQKVAELQRKRFFDAAGRAALEQTTEK